MQRDLPTGTVTFLFTDVEGSTRLLHKLGSEGYAQALAEHRRILRDAFAAHGGVEVDTQGDAFFVAFPTAPGALAAAAQALEGLAAAAIRVRMGIHTGTPYLVEEGYVGADVHRAARIAAAGHGGQILISSSTAALLGTDSLRDLGEHRLKDLSAAERIYQLGDDEFPALKTLYQTNLPEPATPFLGRERELQEIETLLAPGGLRLLTLTGPGGTGKTRLALQAAAEAAERYPDGVFWVPLAPLQDPELVLEAAGAALGAADGVAERIADKRLLLLLDNFEHVIEAAEGVAELIAACPNLQLLVTSRELLRVPAEQAFPVPPLEPQEGTKLFVTRARAADPSFSATPAVEELCAKLDNLPLALELAAARVRVLSPEQLLARLSSRLDLLKAGRGVDPRQQTLRATIEWSHELLDAEEQRLFARLAVFRGGCTLAAAETVCDADIDVLQSLVDKSLVRVRDRDRFWMLETIREYALEQLEASGEAGELQRRHGDYFLAVAEEAEPHILGVDPREALDRLESEHDNIRTALDWLEGTGRIEAAMSLAGAIWEFWCLRGHPVEGWRRLERLLPKDERPTLARAKVLTGSAHLGPHLGASDQHGARAEEALALHRQLGDRWGIAFAEFQYAEVFAARGDFASALPLFEQSVRRLREVGDEHRALMATRAVAWCNLELGDLDRGRAIYARLLEEARAAGDRTLQARALGVVSRFRSQEGRVDEARAMLREAYELDCELGDPGYLAEDLIRFALVLADAGRADEAARVIGRSDAVHEELGVVVSGWLRELRDEAAGVARRQLGEAAFSQAWKQGRPLTTDEAVALALDALSKVAAGATTES